jgi:hypothetical protein
VAPPAVVPKALGFWIFNTPWLIVIAPVYVLAPEKVNAPNPVLVISYDPEAFEIIAEIERLPVTSNVLVDGPMSKLPLILAALIKELTVTVPPKVKVPLPVLIAPPVIVRAPIVSE